MELESKLIIFAYLLYFKTSLPQKICYSIFHRNFVNFHRNFVSFHKNIVNFHKNLLIFREKPTVAPCTHSISK